MKKIFIAITALMLAFACCAPDNTKGYGYNQTEKSKTVQQPSKRDIPHARRIGYNPDTGYYIYLLEADGHKFVMYWEDIEVIE